MAAKAAERVRRRAASEIAAAEPVGFHTRGQLKATIQGSRYRELALASRAADEDVYGKLSYHKRVEQNVR